MSEQNNLQSQKTETQSQNNFLATEKLGVLMRKYSIPCIISLLVGALYNIVDQIFIANASYLGSFGNAANTVVFPLTVVALAIAVMIGDGACAFVSICLGSRQNERAHKTVGNAIVLCVASSLVLTAIYLLFSSQIISAFGGNVNQETFEYSKEYFFWITLGIPFYMFGQGMNPVIRSDGSPKFAMFSTLLGAVLNIILDPIFIFAFKWGMMGAAVATVIGQIATAALSVWYFCHMKMIKLEKKSFRLSGEVIKKFIPLGICSFLSQISLVAAMAAINNMIRKYGARDSVFGQPQYSQIPMAVVGIVMKFFQIVISIVVGMSAGCIPIAGFNIGAGHKERAKKLFLKLLLSEAIVGAVALLIVEVFPDFLIGIFGAANESAYYTSFAEKAFRIYLCMMILACINKATFIYLQALGKAILSTALSMIREVIFGVGFALLLPVWFGLDGVLYSMPVSDILTFVISVIAIFWTCKELSVNDEKQKESQVASDETYKFESENGALRGNAEEEISAPLEGVAENSRSEPAGKLACTSVSDAEVGARGRLSPPLKIRVVAIGRSYGAMGHLIGERLAEKMGVPFYDGLLLEKTAEKLGLEKKYLNQIEEKPFISGANYSLYTDYSIETQAAEAQTEIIEKVSESACVIVGRRAGQILKERNDVLSVFVTASEETRIKNIMKMENTSEEKAKRRMNEVDRNRSMYFNQMGNAKWGNPSSYDLCIDIDKFGIEGAVDLIFDLMLRFVSVC